MENLKNPNSFLIMIGEAIENGCDVSVDVFTNEYDPFKKSYSNEIPDGYGMTYSVQIHGSEKQFPPALFKRYERLPDGAMFLLNHNPLTGICIPHNPEDCTIQVLIPKKLRIKFPYPNPNAEMRFLITYPGNPDMKPGISVET